MMGGHINTTIERGNPSFQVQKMPVYALNFVRTPSHRYNARYARMGTSHFKGSVRFN